MCIQLLFAKEKHIALTIRMFNKAECTSFLARYIYGFLIIIGIYKLYLSIYIYIYI